MPQATRPIRPERRADLLHSEHAASELLAEALRCCDRENARRVAHQLTHAVIPVLADVPIRDAVVAMELLLAQFYLDMEVASKTEGE